MRKSTGAFLLLALMSAMLILQVAPARAESEYDLWANPDLSDVLPVRDYYSNGRYVGQHYIQWMVRYVHNSDPNYDYYALHIIQKVTPSIAYGSGDWRIAGGDTWVRFNNINHQLAHALPTSSSGTLTYGTGASVNSAGVGSFTVTASYSIPDIGISIVSDANWGGYVKWSFQCYDWPSYSDCRESWFHYTALIRVTEGSPISIRIEMPTYWLRIWWFLWWMQYETWSGYESFLIDYLHPTR